MTVTSRLRVVFATKSSGPYEFPLLEWDDDGQRWTATHNPFSGYLDDNRLLLEFDPSRVRAKQHDWTCNGHELGGGSVRLHCRADQEQVFELMGYEPEEMQGRFGALLSALAYGAPLLGGIATGIDRFVMLIADEESIREGNYFPKNQRGVDLMFGAPSDIPRDQLDDIGPSLNPPRADFPSGAS